MAKPLEKRTAQKLRTHRNRGERLEAVALPIGSAAVLTTDRRGELTMHRLGLGFPHRLFVKRARAKSS